MPTPSRARLPSGSPSRRQQHQGSAPNPCVLQPQANTCQLPSPHGLPPPPQPTRAAQPARTHAHVANALSCDTDYLLVTRLRATTPPHPHPIPHLSGRHVPPPQRTRGRRLSAARTTRANAVELRLAGWRSLQLAAAGRPTPTCIPSTTCTRTHPPPPAGRQCPKHHHRAPPSTVEHRVFPQPRARRRRRHLVHAARASA